MAGADQIEDVLPTLPSYLQKDLDAVRNIGNFAAHTQKSKVTGEIIDVEPGEAEWSLDVLDLLFDFYYEQPRIAQEKRDALNKKLAAAAKPPMKWGLWVASLSALTSAVPIMQAVEGALAAKALGFQH